MIQKKISVYITSYNQKTFLVEAIESVLNQTLSPYEIIIVDDCSTDGSPEVIAGYISRYPNLLITPIYHTHNQGVTQSRIDALQAVTGDYVTYVDGDDRFLPTKLEKEAKLLQENPDVKIVFSNYYYINSDGIRTEIWADGEIPPHGNVFCQTFARDFPKRNLFRNELIDYQAWRNIGFHDSSLYLYEDYEMRIRMTKVLRVAYHDGPLAEYRSHKGGLSRAKAKEHLVALKYIYQKNTTLLDDISDNERKDIQRKVNGWMAEIAKRASDQALTGIQYHRANRRDAFKYWLESIRYNPKNFNLRFALQVMLPRRVYQLLRAVCRRFRDISDLIS